MYIYKYVCVCVYIYIYIYIYMHIQRGICMYSGKESTCQCSRFPGWEACLEEEMATHSVFLPA